MEYILSNKKFKDSVKYQGIFYTGDFKSENDILSITEGEIIRDKYFKPVAGNGKTENFIGFYNTICYSPINNQIIAQNDELGMLPLYYFHKKDTFVMSNNLWLIIANVDSDDLKLNIPVIKSFIHFNRIPHESGTFFDNISLLPSASTLLYDISSNKVKISKYWDLEQKPDKNLKISDAVHLLDRDLTSLFKYLKNKYPGATFGFGNSGGLDSRLIPVYARESNLYVTAFITGNPKPRKLFYSTSHKSALKIARELNIPHHNISYKPSNFEERLLLDIRNNPLSNNQVLKNPFDNVPPFDNMFCGGNGFIISNDSNKWKDFKKLDKKDQKIRFLYNYLNKLKYSSRQEKILSALFNKGSRAKTYLQNSFLRDTESCFLQYFEDFYEKHRHKDNISFIRSFHQSICNRHSPGGGFESLNRTKKSFYLYFPWAIANTLKWQDEYFFDRKILKELILRKDKRLALIPDQEGRALIRPAGRYLTTARLVIRGSGLDYRDWYRNSSILKATATILKRDNPLFEELIEGQKNIRLLSKLHANIILDILKIKKILDILYYKELGFIFNKSFEIK
jgi:asparagine synthase (glutamine-hydrolysing)